MMGAISWRFGLVYWGLISGVSSDVFCHMVVMYMYLRMIGLKSEGGMRQGCMSVPSAVSIGTLVTTDADVARKPAEVNVEA